MKSFLFYAGLAATLGPNEQFNPPPPLDSGLNHHGSFDIGMGDMEMTPLGYKHFCDRKFSEIIHPVSEPKHDFIHMNELRMRAHAVSFVAQA